MNIHEYPLISINIHYRLSLSGYRAIGLSGYRMLWDAMGCYGMLWDAIAAAAADDDDDDEEHLEPGSADVVFAAIMKNDNSP